MKKEIILLLFAAIVILFSFSLVYISQSSCKKMGGVPLGYYGLDCFNNKTHEFIN